MSAGAMPASSHAAFTASAASWSSLRPERFENSVWPMPAIAVSRPDLLLRSPAARCAGRGRSARAERSTLAASPRATGRNTGTALPPAVGANVTSTGMPAAIASAATSTRFETRRMPSSRSMSATTGASAKPIGAGWRGKIQVSTRPRPLSFTSSRRVEKQRGHIGRGGCWRSPQSAQRRPSSSPRAAPAQKNAVSGVSIGSGRVAVTTPPFSRSGSRPRGGPGACRSGSKAQQETSRDHLVPIHPSP